MTCTAPIWCVELAKAFSQKGYRFFLVGGAVRDQLLGKEVTEWDGTTEAKPDEIEQVLRAAGAKNIGIIGKQFGTITAAFHGEQLEVTTFRGEQYRDDSRKPVTTFSATIEEDLSRRDFTINAVAFDVISQKIIDPYGGQADLSNNIIRAVGRPTSRFHEDPLRMLRAIRFAVTLGFAIEEETKQAICDEKDRIGMLSPERVAQEIDKTLLAKSPSKAVELYVETGLINYVLPELLPSIDLEFDPREHKDIYHHILQVLDQTPPNLALRWCALLHDIAKPQTRQKIGGEYHFLGHENVGAKVARGVMRRLRYSNEFTAHVVGLVRLHQRIPGYEPEWTDGGVRRFVRDAGDLLDDLFVFAEADQTGKNERKNTLYRSRRIELRARIDALQAEAEIAKIKPPLDGAELIALFNRPAGPWIKPIKEHLLELVLDGKLAADDKAEAENIARSIVTKP
jgi:poly(A) polymerase